MKPRDIDHSIENGDDPRAWAQDFMAHVSAHEICEKLMAAWFRDAMRAAVVVRLGKVDPNG